MVHSTDKIYKYVLHTDHSVYFYFLHMNEEHLNIQQ